MAALTTTIADEAITIKVVAKHGIQTLIGYTRPPVDGGEPSMDDLTSEHPLYRDIRSSHVYDVRGFEDQFTLETHGFQYFKLPSIPGQGVVDFENELDRNIMGIYYAGMSEWFAKEYRIRPRDPLIVLMSITDLEPRRWSSSITSCDMNHTILVISIVWGYEGQRCVHISMLLTR